MTQPNPSFLAVSSNAANRADHQAEHILSCRPGRSVAQHTEGHIACRLKSAAASLAPCFSRLRGSSKREPLNHCRQRMISNRRICRACCPQPCVKPRLRVCRSAGIGALLGGPLRGPFGTHLGQRSCAPCSNRAVVAVCVGAVPSSTFSACCRH